MYVRVYQWRKTDGENFKDRFFYRVTNNLFTPFSEQQSRIIREHVNRNECLNCHHPGKHDKDGCHHQSFIGESCECKKFETPEPR